MCISRFKGRKGYPHTREMQVAGECLKSNSPWASIKLRGHEGLRSGAGSGAAQEEGRPERQKPHLHHSVSPGRYGFSFTPQETHTSQWWNHTFLPQGKWKYFSFCFLPLCCVHSEKELSLQMECRNGSVAVSLQTPCNPSNILHLQPFKTCHFPLCTILRKEEETPGGYWWLQGGLESSRMWKIIQEHQLS